MGSSAIAVTVPTGLDRMLALADYWRTIVEPAAATYNEACEELESLLKRHGSKRDLIRYENTREISRLAAIVVESEHRLDVALRHAPSR